MEEEVELQSLQYNSFGMTRDDDTRTVLMKGPAESSQQLQERAPLLGTSSSTAVRPPATTNQGLDDMADSETRTVTTITEAVKLGREDTLREMLADRSAIEVHQEVKCNLPLHEIVDKGTPEVLEMLLEKLNEQERDAHEDIQSRTLNRATEELMYVRDNEGYTALHKAAIKNKPRMLKLLIKNGGKVDTRNDRGQTPLHIAAWKGSANCIDILIENISEDQLKTYLDSRDNEKATALMRAAMDRHLKVCRKLIQSNVNLEDKEGDTALHHAARSGGRAVVEFLLTECKADSSIKNRKGELAIETAVSSGKDDPDCFILLLQNTTIEDEKSSRANLLKVATLSESIKCLQEMLMRKEFSALIDHKFTDDDNTVLHYSLIKKHYEIARLLLEKNAATNIRNKQQELPAHLLAMIPSSEFQDEDHVQYVHKKMIKGVREKLEGKNMDGKNILELSVASGNEEMIRHLLWYQCSRVAGVLEASRLGKESSLRRLLKALPSNEAVEINRERPHPLHLAAKNGHRGCCAALLDTFKDPDLLLLKDEDGNYPVDLAYKGNHFDVFRFLLQRMKHDPDLEEFAFRLHQYCEESVSGNISRDRMVCIEAIVDSEWCRVAFDSKFCRRGSASQGKRTDVEQIPLVEGPINARTFTKSVTLEIENKTPLCRSLATLVRGFPRLACKILDQHIIRASTEELEKEINADQQHSEGYERHDYAPFEPIMTSNVEDDQNQTPSVTCCPKVRDVISWENHPLLAALDTDNAEFLTHPFSKSWLNYKYNTYAKWLLYFCVVLDALTAIFTSSMFGLLKNTYQLETFYNGATREEIVDVYATITPLDSIDPTIGSIVQEIQTTSSSDPTCSHFNVSTTTGMDMESGMYPPPGTNSWNRTVCAIAQLQQKTRWVVGLQVVVFVLFLVNSWFGATLFVTLRKNILKYAKRLTLVRCALLVSLLTILIPYNKCDFVLGMRQEYVWICGLLSVLLAWMNLIITISRIPMFTGYMEISMKFLTTYVKGILFIFFIILAFALTFYFLLQTEGRAFSTIPYSFLKTLIWMFGDFDYNDTFIENDLPLKYQILSNCLFTLFITVIMGFIFNVIVASPKALLEEIRERSAFHKAKASLMLIYIADLGFPFLRRPFDRKPVLVPRKKTYHSLSLASSSSSSTSGPTDVSPHDQILRHLEIREQFQQMKDDNSQLAQLKDEISQLAQLKDEISQLAQLKDQISQLAQLKDQISQLAQWKDDISQLPQMKDEIKEMTQIVRDLQASVRSQGKSIKSQ